MSGDTFNIQAPGSVGKVQDQATGIVNHYGTENLDALLAKVIARAGEVSGRKYAPRRRGRSGDRAPLVSGRRRRKPQ